MGKYGYLSSDGREYIITRPDTPKPWLNYLSNEKYGCCVTQVMNGYSVSALPSGWRVTERGRDLRPGKYVYVRDNDTGEFWTVNWDPIQKKGQSFRCRAGIGYQIVETKYKGLEMSLRVFVPLNEEAEIWTVKLKNTGKKKLNLSVFPVVEWLLFDDLVSWDVYGWYQSGFYEKETRAVVGQLTHPAKFGLKLFGYMKSLVKEDAFDLRRKAFLGPIGSFSAPEAVKSGKCSNSVCSAEEVVSSVQNNLVLLPGREKGFDYLVGFAGKKDRVFACRKYNSAKVVESEFLKMRAYWEERIQKVIIRTPDAEFNNIVNFWLKYQLLQVIRWQRGFYVGYRDVLQDARGIVPLDAETSAKRILEALRFQRNNGTALRQYTDDGSGRADPRDYKDSPVWMVYAAAKYLKETADLKFFSKKEKYYDKGSDTVYGHCKKTIDCLHRERGARGLTLIGQGDWNDGLSHVGIKGKGESVMLSEQFIVACRDMVFIANILGKKRDAETFEKWAKEMGANIQKHAWNGSWFTRCFSDNGRPVGTPKDDEGKIYINSQSWAIHAGLAAPEQKKKIFESFETLLATKFGPRAVYPPSTYFKPWIGRTTINQPGFAENGGVYCHAAAFKIRADLLEGRGNIAYDAWKKLHPLWLDPDETKADPYVFANCFHGPESPLAGETMYSWLTGTATWMFENATDFMLGARGSFDSLILDPVVPSGWKSFGIDRVFRGVKFKINYHNPSGKQRGVRYCLTDGIRSEGSSIPFKTVKGKKEVTVNAYM